MIGEKVVSAAAALLAEMSTKEGFRAYPLEQTVEPVADVAAHSRAFQAGFEQAVRGLSLEYGAATDASAMREAGVDLEALLSHPPTSATESDLKRFAAWRAGLQWLVLAGRHYSKGSICWSLILIGAGGRGGAPAGEMAMKNLA
jgi:hypothetical protein